MISPEAGYRLAALADGEGCFAIPRLAPRGTKQASFYCLFVVKMREDDTLFLARMKEEIGLGTLRWGTPSNGDGAKRQPWVRWEIRRKEECISLVHIFDEYPLWSKKAQDFAIWREAVFEWSLISNHRGQRADWSRIAKLDKRLKEYRRFARRTSEDVPSP